MNLKIRGLRIYLDNNKNFGFCLRDDAVKEFCDYHKIPYKDEDIYTIGAVPTKKFFIHQKMMWDFLKMATNNNWRKIHNLPMIRRIGKKK